MPTKTLGWLWQKVGIQLGSGEFYPNLIPTRPVPNFCPGFFWYLCFYPHWSRDSLSPVCGIFFVLLLSVLLRLVRILLTMKDW